MQTGQQSSKFAIIFDYILGRAIIFALAFIWCRYYVRELWMAIVFALLILLGFVAVFDLIFKPVKKNTLSEQKEIDKLTEILLYCDKKQILRKLAEIISTKHNAQIKNGYIVLKEDKEQESKQTIIYPFFSPVKLSASDAREILDKLSAGRPDKINILTCGYLPTAADYTDRIKTPKVKLFDQQDLLLILKNYQASLDLEPDIQKEKSKKAPLKVLLAAAFERNRIKGYLFGAMIMIIGSIFIGFSLYYRIFATLFLLLAMLCLRRPAKQEEEIKDFA